MDDANQYALVADSIVKSNGDDGIQADSPDGDINGHPLAVRTKANYNFDWGMEMLADPPSIINPENRATGNGQPQQCLWIECN